jgi:hypothetical protein
MNLFSSPHGLPSQSVPYSSRLGSPFFHAAKQITFQTMMNRKNSAQNVRSVTRRSGMPSSSRACPSRDVRRLGRASRLTLRTPCPG